MDIFWKTDNENGSAANAALGAFQEFMDSPNISKDSIEDSSDDPNELPMSKDSLLPSKASLLAKKRLQAYSANNKLKLKSAQDGKELKEEVLVVEKSEKGLGKKQKKSVYPDDAAKAVIRDIEELKKAGFGGGPIIRLGVPVLPPVDSIPIPLDPFIPISLSKLKAEKSPALSLGSDLDDDSLLFKKREIKCRNIRRSDSFTRRSSSPLKEEKNEKPSKKEVKYPSNWAEYNELELNPREDALLKAKLLKKSQDAKLDYQKYLSFESPAVPIEIYRCQPNIGNSPLWIPFSYLRCTAAKPHILYSTNHLKTQPGHLARNQVLSLVPKERRNIIEKLWKTPSKIQASNRKVTSRKWYPRHWRRFDNNEAKQLEKSVGLSFLRSYSDEIEEEEVEEPVQDVEDLVAHKEANCQETKENDEEACATPELNFDVKTPPLEVQEKEVIALEDEYYKTKKELEMLEASIKDGLHEADEVKESKKMPKSEKAAKKKDKKVRKKKKKVKNKKEEVEESESEDDVKKRPKKAKKEGRKKKAEKRPSKNKKEKAKRKKRVCEDEEKDGEESDNKTTKKAKRPSEYPKKRSKEDSPTRKNSVNITHEGYEDDIKFFTAIFEEEDVRGRAKNRLVLNIDDLTAEQPEKKPEVKVDLLKKNEEYMKVLKEQTKEGGDKKQGNAEESKTPEKKEEEKEPEAGHVVEEKKEVEATSPEVVETRGEHQPNWEQLKSKRKRHIKDKKCDKDAGNVDRIDPDDFQIDLVQVKQEIDVDTWKELPKSLNTSWETDEETVISEILPPEPKQRQAVPESRLLEIPLIIKPFLRREIKAEPQEAAAESPKRSRDLTEEARKLEVEKIRIFELERELKEARLKEAELFDIESPSKRKKRWDIQTTSTPLKVKNEQEKAKQEEEVIDVDANNSNASVTLENEYEEFLKAVTSGDGDCLVLEDTPAPVPSPQVEAAVLDLHHQPQLINFSLSTSSNVTQNITLSLSTSSCSVPISVSQLCEAPPPPPPLPPPEEPALSDNLELEDSPKKIVFTTMTLPTKKLLDNSKLNLDDSDNEEEMEEMRRLKLEELADAEKEDYLVKEKENKEAAEVPPKEKKQQEEVKTTKKKPEEPKRSSPPRRTSTSRLRRKETSPPPVRRRAASPRRRSPRRSPRRKSPVRRKRTPPKRAESPRKRRRSVSPRRRKIRSPSPRGRRRSVTPRPKGDKQERPVNRHHSPQSKRPKSPEQFKQAADSTISDDQLPQSTTMDDFTAPPNLFQGLKQDVHDFESPKRVPLDVRINQVLGYDLPTDSQQYQQYSTIESQVTARAPPSKRYAQSCYQQVGNVLQIVPLPPSQIVQVGNMLEIVPTEMIPVPLPEVKPEETFNAPQFVPQQQQQQQQQQQEKPSAEAAMLQKVAERREERENRRKERERKRKEKEKRRKEKERAKQAKLKIKTENMIKRALELEQEEDVVVEQIAASINQVEEPTIPIQWPPVPTLSCHNAGLKEALKGILTNSSSRKFDELVTGAKRSSKAVQFADGVRPGEGTSPSAGEELSSPPPPKRKLPKEKRYKKVKFGHKSSKKKVKVKIIKKPTSPLDTSDSDDNLPPPSPPPGSPPPYIFPPRVKVHAVNNLPNAYLASIIQSAQQQQQQQQQQHQQHLSPYPTPMYRPPVNHLIMAPPPIQGHLPGHHQSPLAAPTQSPHFHHPGLPPPHPALPGNSHAGHQSGPRHY